MTDVEKTHPCKLSREGVAGEQYCRAMNRQMSTQLEQCAKSACTSPWRFCPVCIVVRALPIHTLREGGVCKVHGEVGALGKQEVISRSKSEVRQQGEDNLTLAPSQTQRNDGMAFLRRKEVSKVISKTKQEVRKLSPRTTPQSLSRRLTRVMQLRLGEKRRRLKSLSQRLARFKLSPTDCVLRPFSVFTYQLAVIENVIRSMPQRAQDPLPTLWHVVKEAADYLNVGPHGLYYKMSMQLTKRDLEELGLSNPPRRGDKPEQKVRQKVVPDFDFARFEKDFDEECRSALLRMSSYRPKDMGQVLREFNAIPKSQWADWDVIIDPLDVAHAINALCADGKRSKARAGALFGRQEFWVETVLKLHKLTPTVRGLIGPKASPHWRLQFGQAVLVSSHQPSKQLACAREEMWRMVRSRYKITAGG